MKAKLLLNADPAAGGGGTPPATPPIKHFADTFPEQYRNDPNIRKFVSIEELGKSYIEQQKLIGKNRLAVPSPNDPPEAYDPLYKAIGRPDKPEEFELPEYDKNKITIDPELEKDVRAEFHKLGLSKGQFKGVMGRYTAALQKMVDAAAAEKKQAFEQGMSALQNQHGDKTNMVIEIAQAGIRHLAGDKANDLVAKIEKAGLGSDPDFINLMHAVGKNFVQEDPTGAGKILSPEATAQQEIAALQQDPEFQKALNDRTHPGHKAAVERQTAIFRRAYEGQRVE